VIDKIDKKLPNVDNISRGFNFAVDPVFAFFVWV